MQDRTAHKSRTLILVLMLSIAFLAPVVRAQDSNAAKARALVDAAIKMTDSNAAVKLLWQAADIDPTLEEAYLYLGAYYNSRSDFENVVKVYKQLVKNEPHQVSGYLNIGEAYLSFSPPRKDDALVYYHKAYALDPATPSRRSGSARCWRRREAARRRSATCGSRWPTVRRIRRYRPRRNSS